MLSVEKVYETFLSHDVDFFTGVPDSLLKNICAYITDHTSREKHIIAANEGAAVGIASGYYMASVRFLWFICKIPAWVILLILCCLLQMNKYTVFQCF